MKHFVRVTMENSTAALLRVIGMLRRRGIVLVKLDLIIDDHNPAIRLAIQLESQEPVDLLYRQLQRFISVYEVTALTEDGAEKPGEAAHSGQ